MSTKNKATRHDGYLRTISGLQSELGDTKTLKMAGETHRISDLVALLQDAIDTTTRADGLYAQWRAAVAEAVAAEAKARKVRTQLRSYVVATVGSGPRALDAFGFDPAKVSKKDVATLVRQVDKMRATRKARNTMGAKQKKNVKGTVA